MKDLPIVTNDRLGKIIWSLRNSPMNLLTLSVVFFKCLPKFDLSSKNIPRCFWYRFWFTGILLKINTGWFGFLILREKMTSWACLEGSGLKLIFHWKPQLHILMKSFFNSFAYVFLLWTTEKGEVPSAKGQGLDDKPVDKSLMWTKNNKGPKIEPWGTPASLQPIQKIVRLELLFDIYLKGSFQWSLVNFLIYHFVLVLIITPWWQTLSNAFDMSRMFSLLLLTSRPLSKNL